MCGRRPIEEGKPPLIELVWQSMTQGQLLDALDPRIKARGGFDEEEVERILHLGLLCTYPEPSSRPKMRQAVKILEGKNEPEIDDMNAYLLQHTKSKDMWLNYSHGGGYSYHPTSEDIKKFQSSFTSLSWSNSEREGKHDERDHEYEKPDGEEQQPRKGIGSPDQELVMRGGTHELGGCIEAMGKGVDSLHVKHHEAAASYSDERVENADDREGGGKRRR
ncbi:hypothetical protein GH714_002391 [Hevea brasiliensis]|uniref:Serine-threonine/tyrosine-protein kinase catalytic domain-containing protein n=1 Tax=Hevea brasiliensis TaxID=3981 RepID=A0A6A6LDI9_HEVBR|nr:hypothetical protein GH714_002391 [Hevea brasiliensis]